MTLAREHHPAADFTVLQSRTIAELQELARAEGLEPAPNQTHSELLATILERLLGDGALGLTEGVLELLPDGYGFVRSPHRDYGAQPHDAFVSPAQIRRLNLKPGHFVAGPVRAPRRGERFFAMHHVERVNGGDETELLRRVPFASRTPVLPTRRLSLDHAAAPPDVRTIDLLAPWAMGQRALITTPADPGRARLFASLGEALLRNHADLRVLICMIDQQPEDVAVVRRALAGEPRCEIVASTFDELPLRHMALAELALLRAQREVEAGRDIVVLFDSLTALARACNVEQPPTGRLLCAGMDAAAVQRGKRLFAAARACEEGGSLTVMTTCVRGDTRGDEAVLEEFRHRGNSEVTFAKGEMPGEAVLDVLGTATRAEDLLLCDEARAGLRQLRLALAALPPAERLAYVRARLAKVPQARDLLRQLAPHCGSEQASDQGLGR